MKKRKCIMLLIIIAIILMILNFNSGISFASKPTRRVIANSPEYYRVEMTDENKINCKFISEYDSNKRDNLREFDAECNLEISNDTIFINGKEQKIVDKEKALKSIKEDMVIIAYLEEDAYDVEHGIQNKVSIVVYNITDNIIADDYVSPRYYRSEKKFSFYGYELGEKNFTVDAQKVYDKNGKTYDTDSIVLWKELPGEEMPPSEYDNDIAGDYVTIYWRDGNEQIDKVFLIDVTEEDIPETIIEEKENNNFRSSIFVIIIFTIVIFIVLWYVRKNKK